MKYRKPSDEENARRREEIAQKLFAVYQEAFLWALGKFGPGWIPTGMWKLIDKEEEDRSRRARGPDNPLDTPTPAAVVYVVDHERLGRKFFIRRDGRSVEVASYEEGFGDMMHEPHPTLRLKTVKGGEEEFSPPRYSLFWGGFEPAYRPQEAEALAKRRKTREENKEKKRREQERQSMPLFFQDKGEES